MRATVTVMPIALLFFIGEALLIMVGPVCERVVQEGHHQLARGQVRENKFHLILLHLVHILQIYA